MYGFHTTNVRVYTYTCINLHYSARHTNNYCTVHRLYLFCIDIVRGLCDVIEARVNDGVHPSVALGKLAQQLLVLVDPSSVHVLELGEEGGHVRVEMVASKGVALLELEDVGVATLLCSLLLLSKGDRQLSECVCEYMSGVRVYLLSLSNQVLFYWLRDECR